VIRRSFRIGLLLGLAAGLVRMLSKLLQGRQEQAPDSAARPWSPLDDHAGTTDGQAPVPAAPRAAPGPDEPSAPAPSPVTDLVEEAEAGSVAEPLDAEAAAPAGEDDAAPPEDEGAPADEVPVPAEGEPVPPEPAEPVEKAVPPPKEAPPRKAAAKKAAAKKAAGKRAAGGKGRQRPLKADVEPPDADHDVAPAWVEPDAGVCPTSHPVKAKLSSKLFHLPGMAAYDRTNPDRCYRDAVAAEADGLRAAKR
jgi:hypothetical protein